MKKLLISLAILAFTIPAYGRVLDLWVGDGTGVPDTYDQDTGDSYFEACMELDGDFNVDGVVWLSEGTVLLPGLVFHSDVGLDSGFYYIADDSFGISIGGANVGTWSATGLAVAGIDGPIGAVVPAAGIFTTVDGTDATFTGDIAGGEDLGFGQDPPDQFLGYKDRSDFITFQDDFTVSVDTEFVLDWDETNVVGAGTNTVSVRPGWNELVTGGAGVDSESTRSWGLTNDRAFTPRMESVVDLTNLVTQRFEWGFLAAANEYVVIAYDVAVGANWLLQIDDTTGAETVDSLVAATVDPTKLEIAVDAAGNVTWAINDVAMPLPTGATLMTANPHYTWWELTDTAAAAHTVAIDYVQIEQLKMQ
jgi:hypothetical protein